VRRAIIVSAVCALACVAAQPAAAQPAAPQRYIGREMPHAGSVEVSGGLLWNQGFDFGSVDATLTRNPGTGTGPFTLFTAGTGVDAGIGVQARVGVFVTRTVSVEGGVQYSRPVLSSELSNDVEEAANTTASETLARYVFDGTVLCHFGRGKMRPFVAAGGGYLRELHDGYGVVETGNEFHAGAGIKYWFTGRKQRFGVRAEAGAMSRSGGVDFEDKRRTIITAFGGVSYLF
jgi:hypothetical protein